MAKGSDKDLKEDAGHLEERKLSLIMDEEPVMAKVYQQVYREVKEEAEAELDELRAKHALFDEAYDDEKMGDKLPSEWYDVREIDRTEDIQYSTDFTDPADDLLYKRHKMHSFKLRESLQAYNERIKAL